MARTPRGGSLETRTARLKLAPRPKPVFVSAGMKGAHLGYRRNQRGNGTWILRRYIGDKSYSMERIADADDFADSDGQAVLTYHEAIAHVRRALDVAPTATSARKTLNDVAADYLRWLTTEKGERAGTAARQRYNAYIKPTFGEVPLPKITHSAIEAWRLTVANCAPLRRHKASAALDLSQAKLTAEQQRARKATANRIWTILRAILNHAFANGVIASKSAWQRVKPFRDVGRSRVQYLESVDHMQRLLSACAPDFRNLVRAALETGGRYGELTRLTVDDYLPRQRAVRFRAETTKSRKQRTVPLSPSGVAFFEKMTAGRAAHEIMLQRAEGGSWRESDQTRRINAACVAAGIRPITFHGLRDTYAVHLVSKGVSTRYVAECLGHADTRITEKHYGHLVPSHLHKMVATHLPALEGRNED